MSGQQNRLQKERNQKILLELVSLPGNSQNTLTLGAFDVVAHDHLRFGQTYAPIVKPGIRDGRPTIWGYSSGKL